MIHGLVLALFAALALVTEPAGTPAAVSDPVAVYALVTEVRLLPDAEQPRSVRLYGAFAIAGGERGDYYLAPRWGSMHFGLTEGQEDKCRAQWADLARIAGKGDVVGFGFRHRMPSMSVQRPGEETEKSVPYPTGYGLRRVRNVDYGPARSLRLLPRPLSPTSTCALPSWSYARQDTSMVTLVAENCLAGDAQTKYLFEDERPGGEVIGSPPIEAGQAKTSWSVWLVAEPGETIAWRVRVLRDDVERAPVATASFTAKASPR